jgi:predicted ATPase
MKAGNTAIALAIDLSHPFSLAFAQCFASWLREYRGEPQLCREMSERNITLCTERGFPFPLALATVFRGYMLAQQGNTSEGIAQIREGIAAYRATGAELETQYWFALLAKACAKKARLDESSRALDEAPSQLSRTGPRFCEAELHRLKGELSLARPDADVQHAERCYREALEVAQRQSAKSWELRTAASLARLLRDTGRRDEARTMLAEIYGWFTEGFETADLKDAKALLDQLNS